MKFIDKLTLKYVVMKKDVKITFEYKFSFHWSGLFRYIIYLLAKYLLNHGFLRLRVSISFAGPASDGGGRGGSVLVLKGLVLPQWRRRDVEVVGDKLFIHPGKLGKRFPIWHSYPNQPVKHNDSFIHRLG